MEIKFCDLKRQYSFLRERIENRVGKVISNGNFVAGQEIKEIERKLKEFVGAKHAIGVSSGTDAL